MIVRRGAGTLAALALVLCFACGRAGPPVRSRPAAPPAAPAPASVPDPAQPEPDPEEKQP